MSLFKHLQSLTGFKPAPPKRKTAEISGTIEFFETSRLIAGLIFIATVAAIVLISFVGVNTASLPVLPNQYASVRIVASGPFSYESAEKTRIALEQIKNRVPPVYRIELEPLHQFEANIRELLATSLRFAGFEVHVAADGATALKQASEHDPDLVVLDVMLPDMDGFTVTRKLREAGRVLPIVFVTARDSLEDKIQGLTVGGDDYVTKPFSLEEVVARIRAVLRRTRGGVDEDDAILRFHDLELDEDSHEVRRNKRVIEVSPTEFKLLRYLMLNPNRVLSKAQILDHVWDYDFRGQSGIVESYISYLRRKIDVEEPALIQTRRGVGYVLRLPAEST